MHRLDECSGWCRRGRCRVVLLDLPVPCHVTQKITPDLLHPRHDRQENWGALLDRQRGVGFEFGLDRGELRVELFRWREGTLVPYDLHEVTATSQIPHGSHRAGHVPKTMVVFRTTPFAPFLSQMA